MEQVSETQNNTKKGERNDAEPLNWVNFASFLQMDLDVTTTKVTVGLFEAHVET